MRALIWRELAVIWRTGSFWAAIAGYVSLLSLFVVVWGDGVPVVNGGTNWEQFGAIQQTILVLVFPWIAARCAVTPRRSLVVLAVATASNPSRLLLARCLALAVSLAAAAACALPIVLVMQQIAGVPIDDVAEQLVPLAGLATFVAVVTTGFMATIADRLRGWVAATAVTAAAGSLVPLSVAGTPIWIGLALAAATPLLLTIDGILTYLPEEAA